MALKASELRIGNYVSKGDEIIKVDSIDEVGINLYAWHTGGEWGSSGHIEPDFNHLDILGIPITEEWLLRFGFQDPSDSHGEYLSLTYRGQTLFSTDVSTAFKYVIYTQHKAIGELEIHYVHELQNLYFALKGIELTLTDKTN